MALQLRNKKRQRGHSGTPSAMMIEDPFTRTQMDVFSHMNRMMSGFDNMVNDMRSAALTPFHSASNRRAQLHSERSFPFGISNNILASDPNCHMYSTSQVMSMAVGPDGCPQMYQASTSTKALPGGIRETKKTLCDSRSGVKKMSLGHHIGERGRIIERQKNLFSGEEEEHQEFINIDEEEAAYFDREFEHRVIKGEHAVPAASAVHSSPNRPKGNTILTKEMLSLSGQRSNSAVSQQHKSRLPSGRGNKGIIKGALRKIRK